MTEPTPHYDRLTPSESERYKNDAWLNRNVPLKRKRATPRKVKLPLFVCSKQRCTNPVRWFGWCALHARDEADRLFSRYVRARDERCVNCGDAAWAQCAHLISRRYFALRWNPENAVQLCRACHKRYTENPLAWDRWCRARVGDETWDAMKFRAERGGMPDLGVVIEELRTLMKEVAA